MILLQRVNASPPSEVDNLMRVRGHLRLRTRASRRQALAATRLRFRHGSSSACGRFLKDGGFGAFTTTFEDLHGLDQLPGLAAQRLMGAGYGFAGEGDWKTAGLVRVMKTMAGGIQTSFMEDYTYHLDPTNELVLGSHMLEICPIPCARINRVSRYIHYPSAAKPIRRVSSSTVKPARRSARRVVDMGNRFRLIINNVDAVAAAHAMPKLPVARVLWKPQPSLRVAAETWIQAGGAHHTGFSLVVNAEQMIDWAEMTGIECVVIDADTKPIAFRNELRQSAAAWR